MDLYRCRPRQIALAILADHLGDDAREAFMQAVVAHRDNAWRLDGAEIDAALAAIDQKAL